MDRIDLLLDDAAAKFLNVAAARLGWSARGTHRMPKVARTVDRDATATMQKAPGLVRAVGTGRAARSGCQLAVHQHDACRHKRNGSDQIEAHLFA